MGSVPLNKELTVQQKAAFTPEFLTVCSIYRLTDREPIYAGRTEEGDVAWYGLLLQSDPDNRQIRDYLLGCAKGSLWEYQHGFGVTSTDSALVLEGLLAAGVDHALLRESAAALVHGYFNPEEGAFRTVLSGRAAYWEGVSPETTALIAYLLLRIDPDTYAGEIASCAEYLARTQNPDSTWSGKWFPSLILPTWYALRFLHCYQARRYQETILRSRNWIVRAHRDGGGWGGSIIETALALMTLRTLKDTALVLDRGESWLREQRTASGWKGEPVLYYWFEEGSEKLFYSCQDKGAITSAWARLATNLETK